MRYRLTYRFENTHGVPVQLYLSLPQDRPGQRVRELRLSRRPNATYAAGENTIATFPLAPNETIHLTAHLELTPPTPRAAPFPQAALQGDPLSPLTPEIVALAEKITQGAATPEERLARIVAHLAQRLNPAPPPRARGATHTLRRGAGDAVEYALLLVVLARAAGLPARAVFGALAGPTRPHAWAEVYLGGAWRAVDPFLYQALQHHPAHRLTLNTRLSTTAYLHTHEGRRVAFSIGVFPPLRRADPPHQVPGHAERVLVAERPLAWGYETEAGTAPFLHPAYVLALGESQAPAQPEAWSGAWRLEPEGWRGLVDRALPWARGAALSAGLLALLGFPLPPLLSTPLYAVYLASLALQQGVGWARLLLSPRLTDRLHAAEAGLFQGFLLFVLLQQAPLAWGLGYAALFLANRLRP
ncbi:transglutaminase domain-containing protein [Marinithermus hydrothermalis]|uniref:Transglutaminase domain-containing protein n=1 Tax=Marinithermus hydrothermalis (strain DSM 14884 / JCM 11576 / T1) TaxID=869210 RepID=F2NLK7_MARHT|nr:transglutaminase domain-containing protein [Marinithermus hydrothermalis]AEB12106.1 transglutaminase domain-containing protein [Marinithermus hydrothermalis DSM 14884]